MHHAKPILVLGKGISAHSFITILPVMKTQKRKLPLLEVTSHPHSEGGPSHVICELPRLWYKEAFADSRGTRAGHQLCISFKFIAEQRPSFHAICRPVRVSLRPFWTALCKPRGWCSNNKAHSHSGLRALSWPPCQSLDSDLAPGSI